MILTEGIWLGLKKIFNFNVYFQTLDFNSEMKISLAKVCKKP